MYDFTPQQYDSLTKLTAALCTVLPKIRRDYPRDEHGNLITHKLADDQLAAGVSVQPPAERVSDDAAAEWR